MFYNLDNNYRAYYVLALLIRLCSYKLSYFSWRVWWKIVQTLFVSCAYFSLFQMLRKYAIIFASDTRSQMLSQRNRSWYSWVLRKSSNTEPEGVKVFFSSKVGVSSYLPPHATYITEPLSKNLSIRSSAHSYRSYTGSISLLLVVPPLMLPKRPPPAYIAYLDFACRNWYSQIGWKYISPT